MPHAGLATRAFAVGRALRRAAAVCLVALAAPRCGRGPAAGGDAPGPSGPDVLLLVMDTTRADRCSFLGYGRPTTPRLEALARESVVFENAWSPAPWTMPAHAALFTGRRPEALGIVEPRERPVPAGVPTIATELAAAGWSAGCFTNNPWIAAHSGLTRGFGFVEHLDTRPGGPSAAEAHRRALEWMTERRRAGERFFAFVNDMEPHTTWDPPADVTASFVDPALPAPVVADVRTILFPRSYGLASGREPLSAEHLLAASDLYDAEIAGLDREVGALVDGMRAAGLLDGTLLIVASDHGEGLGDHGWLEHGLDLHREALHVPLLVRPPGGVAPRRVADVVRLEDVLPTVLRACGIPAPDGIDGLPLLDARTGGRLAIAADCMTTEWAARLDRKFGAGTSDPLRGVPRSVFDGRFHLLEGLPPVGDAPGGSRLYDVLEDPAERRDLFAERPDEVARLRALLR